MKNLLKSKRALSTVITTLIILVISVLLATVVTYYAMNMVSTRVIQEDGRITQLSVWVNCTDGSCAEAQAAFVFKNTGGRDILLDKITVRYQDIAWSDVYHVVQSTSVTAALNYSCTASACTDFSLSAATQEICLQTGQSIIVYMDSPDTVDCLDIGTPLPIGIHTSNAIYYKETTVHVSG